MKKLIFLAFLIANFIAKVSLAEHINECLKYWKAHNTSYLHLDFELCNLEDSDMPQLVKLMNEYEFDYLDLSYNHLTGNALQTLANAENATRFLRSLELKKMQMNDEGYAALQRFKSLSFLDLSYTDVGDAGAVAIAKITHLYELYLDGAKIGDAGAIALGGKNHSWSSKLSLNENDIGDKGAEALAMRFIDNLALNKNKISDAGAEALAASKNIRILALGNNNIGDAGAAAFGRNYVLEELRLNNNKITAVGAEGLANNSSILKLDVSGNAIGDTAAQLFKHRRRHLYLANCDIGPMGAVILAHGRHELTEELNLYNNHIGDEGAFAFARHLMPKVLRVGRNGLGYAAVDALRANQEKQKSLVDFNDYEKRRE